jgi:CheY-like chemotaxis protein
VRNCGETLLTLINDILDFSKIEAGKVELEELDFDARTATEEIVELLAPQAHGKRLVLARHVSPDVPSSVRGDPSRLRQVLTNLLGNAIKFTEAGEVAVRLTCLEESAADVLLRFEVQDSGIGFDDAQRARLFSPSRRPTAAPRAASAARASGCRSASSWWSSWAARSAATACPARAAASGSRCAAPHARVRARATGPTSSRACASSSWTTTRPTAPSSRRRSAAGACRPSRRPTPSPASTCCAPRGRAARPSTWRWWTCRCRTWTASSWQPGQGRPGHRRRAAHHAHLAGRQRREAARAAGRLLGLPHKPARPSQLFDCIAGTLSALADERAAEERARAQRAASGAPDHGPRPLVLVAEDNAVNQKVAQRLLEKQGYRCDVVANGAEAVEALQRIEYAAVLMDCQMPEMDGYAATARIRQLERGRRHTPIIAMTANAMAGDREKSLAAGMDDYVSKPVRVEELNAALARWIGRGAQDAGQPAPARPTPA